MRSKPEELKKAAEREKWIKSWTAYYKKNQDFEGAMSIGRFLEALDLAREKIIKEFLVLVIRQIEFCLGSCKEGGDHDWYLDAEIIEAIESALIKKLKFEVVE